MNKPRLLDLFCGQGGASMGYWRAGFDVVGVDKMPQPRYPLDFRQADAFEYLADHWHEFDAVHASPTCQTRSRVTAWRGSRDNHPDTLTPILSMLKNEIKKPWVVENVVEAVSDGTLDADIVLCGTMFGLPIRRHRAFQSSSGFLVNTAWCAHTPDDIPFVHKGERAYADAMGCVWMTNLGGRQAIPPDYAEFIGAQLLERL